MTNRVPLLDDEVISMEFTSPIDDKAQYLMIGREHAKAEFIFLRKGRKVIAYKQVVSNTISSPSVPSHMAIFFVQSSPRVFAPISEDLILYRKVVRRYEKDGLDIWKSANGYK